MKNRIIVSSLLVMLLSIGMQVKADAAPWRGGYRCGPAVRVVGPRVGICAPGVVVGVGGGYYGGYAPAPVYYGPRYYGYAGPRYYGRPYYRGRGWRRY